VKIVLRVLFALARGLIYSAHETLRLTNKWYYTLFSPKITNNSVESRRTARLFLRVVRDSLSLLLRVRGDYRPKYSWLYCYIPNWVYVSRARRWNLYTGPRARCDVVCTVLCARNRYVIFSPSGGTARGRRLPRVGRKDFFPFVLIYIYIITMIIIICGASGSEFPLFDVRRDGDTVGTHTTFYMYLKTTSRRRRACNAVAAEPVKRWQVVRPNWRATRNAHHTRTHTSAQEGGGYRQKNVHTCWQKQLHRNYNLPYPPTEVTAPPPSLLQHAIPHPFLPYTKTVSTCHTHTHTHTFHHRSPIILIIIITHNRSTIIVVRVCVSVYLYIYYIKVYII